MSQLKTIKEKRAAAHAAAVAEMAKPEQTVETRAAADKALAEVETLSADITRIERADAMAAQLGNVEVVPVVPAPEAQADAKAAYRAAFAQYLQKGSVRNARGYKTADPKNLAILEKAAEALRACGNDVEKRDQLAGSQSITYTEGNVGGYFVPAGFVYDIEKATKFFAPLLDGLTIRILETATGQVLPYPTSNDTNNAWTLLGEASQVSDQGTTPNYVTPGSAPTGQPGNVLAGHVNFNAYKGTTGLIRVSLELLQDSAFNIESFLTEAFATRLGRGYEYYLTNGSGSNAPTGILPAIAASGATPIVAAGSSANDGSANTGANSIGYADLINLIHSVNPTYRYGAKFMFADTTLRFLRTLLDKFGTSAVGSGRCR